MNSKEFCAIYIGVWTYGKRKEKFAEVNGATRDDDVTALLVYDLQDYFRGPLGIPEIPTIHISDFIILSQCRNQAPQQLVPKIRSTSSRRKASKVHISEKKV
jgi:hypothetical protein